MGKGHVQGTNASESKGKCSGYGKKKSQERYQRLVGVTRGAGRSRGCRTKKQRNAKQRREEATARGNSKKHSESGRGYGSTAKRPRKRSNRVEDNRKQHRHWITREALTSHECLSRSTQRVGLVGVQLGVGPPQLSLMVQAG